MSATGSRGKHMNRHDALIHFDWYGTAEWEWAIKKLAELSLHEYEERRRAAAKALGVRVRRLDAEVGGLRSKPAEKKHVRPR